MRVIWATDLHLNYVDDQVVEGLFDRMAASDASAVLLGGDIGEAFSVGGYLERCAAAVSRPTYFVLGNHDYYGGGTNPLPWTGTDLDLKRFAAGVSSRS